MGEPVAGPDDELGKGVVAVYGIFVFQPPDGQLFFAAQVQRRQPFAQKFVCRLRHIVKVVLLHGLALDFVGGVNDQTAVFDGNGLGVAEPGRNNDLAQVAFEDFYDSVKQG